ncbi:MAG: sugar ABC transporter substrate-binding protein [Psychrilyobacter sp.]|uniref:sugar ABC transporter substrate-binding protein n=1 Tax=Psychrilyobacter sp. TaxID=2586924 RepID=UPI003C758C39
MKKVLLLVLSTIILLGVLSGCGKKDESANSEEKEIVIGFASSSFTDKWQTYLNDAARTKGEEMGVKMIFTDGKNDPSTQLANVENYIVEGVDAIIIVMVDTSAPKPIVNACKEAGIPLIAVNRNFEGSDVFVGSDEIMAGELQMEYVLKKLGGKGNVAILQGTPGFESAEKRTNGNEKDLKANPGMKIIFKDSGLWDRAKGMEITENWLESGEKIDAILANNDEMAIGAIRALTAANKNDQVIVGGVDGTIDALKYVKEGTLEVTVFQNPFGQGDLGVESAIKMAKGEKVTKFVEIPFEQVTIDNVDKYIKIWE